jgi:ADP-ribose pyrophosphatase YjhB (NUDIX family)
MPEEHPGAIRPVVAVGGVIVRDAAALIVRRGKEPLRGRWSIPGGAVEAGETLVGAVIREMREETSLEVAVVELLQIVEPLFRDAAGNLQHHYVIHDFLCSAPPLAEPRAGGDAEAIAWVREADFASFSLSDSVIEVLRKALAIAS